MSALHEDRPALEQAKSSHSTHSHDGSSNNEKTVVDEKPTLDSQKVTGVEDDGEYPTGPKLYLIMFALFMFMFIAALDQTILAPAIPIISNQFNTTSDVGWYLSAYYLTVATLLPVWARFYRYDLKWTYLACIIIFEVGSLICAVAQDSVTFIVGRAIAGLGCGGAYTGVMTIIAASVPLDKKAFWNGNVGSAYGLGAVVGPLIGGAFTTHVTWRWCFWINLPIGGFTVVAILLFFRPPTRSNTSALTTLKKMISDVDWIGTALLLGACISLLLVLQDGGLTRAWDDSVTIGLLVGFVAILVAFAGLQAYLGDKGLIPPRLFKQRTILSASMANIGLAASYFIVLSFLPIYYQIRGSSSIRSGVQMLPLITGVITTMILTGGLAPKVGYVHPFMLYGLTMMAVFSGVMSLLDENSSQAFWGATSFLFGTGAGACWQFGFIAAQTTMGKPFNALDTEQAATITLFFQTFGGSMLVASAQSIFQNEFRAGVQQIAGLPNAIGIAEAGETAFRQLVSPEFLPAVERVAIEAVQKTFYLAAAVVAASVPWVLGIEWNSLKGQAISGGAA